MPDEILAPLAVGALVVAILSLLLVFGLALRLRGLTRRSGIQVQPTGAQLERMDAQHRQIDALTAEQRELADRLLRAVTRVGVVRFNPFDDTGGNQSFALALLDGRSDGIVLSSLHSRQQTRVYLKAIQAGAAESALSAEESEALRQAIGG